MTLEPPASTPASDGVDRAGGADHEENADHAGPRPEGCLSGGGQLGARMRGVDWSATPLGPVSAWPQSLRTALSMMLESGFAMAVAWGPELRLFYNDRYAPILGTRHPQALGAPCAEVFSEIWHIIGPELEGVRRGGTFAIDDRLLPLERSGYRESCWFSSSFSPIRDESGGIGGLLAVVAETTGRVEGERRLATLRELAATAARGRTMEEACEEAAAVLERNSIDVPFAVIYALDEDGRVARRIAQAGLSPDHPAAPEVIELDPPEPVAGWPVGRVARVSAALVLTDLPRRFGPLPGGPYPEPAHSAILLPLSRPGLEHPYGVLVAGICPRRALDDRGHAFFELAAEHVATAIGNARAPRRAAAAHRQTLDRARRRAEATADELQRAIALVEATLANVPVGLAVFNHELRFVQINGTLAQWNGWDPRQIVGRTLEEIAPPASYAWLAPRVLEVIATGRASEPAELGVPSLARPDELRHWLITCYPVYHGLVGMVAVDVTNEISARDRLARTIEYNDKFTAILGHDLRNPLNAIMTTAQLLQRRAKTDEIARPATRIVASGERMLRMINQLYDLARVRVTGGLRLQPRSVDLAELCQNVVDELRAAYPGASLELVTAGDLVGRWDGDRLAQVLSNLVGNALEHGARAPVRVRLDGREPGRAVVRVENQGVIPDAILPHLFDPFRGAERHNAKARGLGLGLYISHEIVIAHGGTLTVRSNAEAGTCFEVALPRPEAGEAGAPVG